LLDFAHLSRQTADDIELQHELLALFKQQTPELMAKLHALTKAHDNSKLPPTAWAVAHRLKGSALAIGAFPLAEAVEAAERAFTAGHPSEDALAALAQALADALAEIDHFMTSTTI